MMEFRFIHTADIHLDSPLKGLADYQGGAAARIRMAVVELRIGDKIPLTVVPAAFRLQCNLAKINHYREQMNAN